MLHKRKNVEKLEKKDFQNLDKKKDKKPRWRMYLVVGLVFVMLLLGLLSTKFNVFAMRREGMCILPENSIYTSADGGTYYDRSSGIEVVVVRGVKNGPFMVQGNRNSSLPPCSSNDADLMPVNNLFLENKDDGTEIFLISGVIVYNQELIDYYITVPQNQEVIPEAETPLP